jgi:aspartyl-tRNA(Asn)/glutamyl-tRNA(Gln) amidotransferase subunit C
MTISREDVLRVAALARLDLDEESLEGLVRDLDQIVGYVRKLDELDTSHVPPTAQAGAVRAPLRPDVAAPGTPTDLALREAPRSTSEGFRVPAFVDET